MSLIFPEAILVALLSIFLVLVLCAALALVVVNLRRPATTPLIVATGLVVFAAIVVAVSPLNVPLLMGLMVALLGTALAVLGGDPVTRRVLDIATHGRVRQGINGGIFVASPPGATPGTTSAPVQEIMRGGAAIGYLERVGVAVALIAGYPEAIAVVVAVKGVGRFSELASSEARERFIIGTLASLLWACIVGALVRLAIW